MKILTNLFADKDVLRGAFIILGSVVGAGIFFLPYAASKIGFFGAIISLLIGISVGLFLALLYLEALLKVDGHRMSDIPRRLGYKHITHYALFTKYLSIYLAAFIYVVSISEILHYLFLNFFGINISMNVFKLILISIFFVIIYMNPPGYGKIESVLVYGLYFMIFFMIIYLFISKFSLSNLFSVKLNLNMIPLFIGLFLFACFDYMTCPEVYKMLGYNAKKLKKSVLLAYLLVFTLYLFFIVAFLGVYGTNVKEIAIENFTGYLLIISSFILIISMMTSGNNFLYIAKDTLIDRFGISNLPATLITVLPLFSSLFFPGSIIEVVDALATISTANSSIFISLISEITKKKVAKETPIKTGYTIPFTILLSSLVIFAVFRVFVTG